MKNKQITKLLLLLMSVFLWSCQDEEKQVEILKASLSLDEAKNWVTNNFSKQTYKEGQFKANGAEMSSIESEILLNWNLANIDNDSIWSVVELPWEYKEGFVTIANSEVKDYSLTTKTETVQVQKLVLLKNRVSGEIFGFKMVVVPELNYMLSNFENISTINYFRRDPEFTGAILFYNITGDYINGWQYSDGRVAAKLLSKDTDSLSKISSYRKSASEWVSYSIETCYYSYATVGGYTSEPQLMYCKTEYFTELVDDNLNNIGGTGTGGVDLSGAVVGSGSTGVKTPGIRTNCPSSASLISLNINGILGSSNSDYPAQSASVNVSDLQKKAQTEPYEWGMSINYSDNYYWVMGANGIYLHTNNSSNNVTLDYINSTVLVCHTHPNGTLFSPSPSDAIFLGRAYKGGAVNISSNVVFAHDGSSYTVYVSDKTAFQNFCNNSSNNSFFTPNGSLFQSGTSWANDYNTVCNNLKNQGYSQSDANSYAVAYVLDKYNTGMKIAEKTSGDSSYREQETTQTTDTKNRTTYQPQKCPQK